MDEHAKQLATAKRKHLEDWLQGYQKLASMAPYVVEACEVARWEEDTLCSVPGAASGLPWEQLVDPYQADLDHVRAVLPVVPPHDASQVRLISAASTTSGSASYSLVALAGRLPDERAQQWSAEQRTRYHALQESAHRCERVRSLLVRLCPKLATEFDEAERSYRAATGAGQSASSAAFAMRNVLEHCKGELFTRARRWPKENMTWPTMAERLASQSMGPASRLQLEREGDVWGELEKDLSNIGKGQAYGASLDLVAVHTQFLDHLFAVLSLTMI